MSPETHPAGGTPEAVILPPGQAYRIYVVLCAGFFVSQFYRVSNAVIAPELMRELAISAEAMGIVAGIYFLAFAAVQLPTGLLLDRFGLRRTMAGLFLVAVAGFGDVRDCRRRPRPRPGPRPHGRGLRRPRCPAWPSGPRWPSSSSSAW